MSNNRSVNVGREEREITYLDKEGETKQLGIIRMDEFQGEGIRKFNFQPSADNPWSRSSKKEEGYALGIGSERLTFVDPADTMRVLLDRGWTMTDQIATSGGLEISSTFVLEDMQLADPINWDSGVWDNPNRHRRPGTHERTNILFPAIRVDTSLYVGRMAATINTGIYRLTCTNGLISQLLELPGMKFRHDTWDVDAFNEFLGTDGATQTSLPRGREIATIPNLNKAIKLLTQYSEELNSVDGISDRFKGLQKLFKSLGPSVLSPWVLKGYIEQLQLMAEQRSEFESVYMIDMVGAYTSAVNLHRDDVQHDRGAWSALYVTDKVIQSTGEFATMAGLFSN